MGKKSPEKKATDTIRPMVGNSGAKSPQSEDYYSEFFKKSPVATALLNNKDQVMEINEAFHHLFGYSAEEAEGKYINDLIAYIGCTEEAIRFSENSIAGRVVNEETMRFHKSGESIPVSVLAYPVYDSEKEVAVYATYSDIRERLIYERKLNVYSKILEKSTEAVCVFNDTGTVLWVNQTFHDLIGSYEEQWMETLQSMEVIPGETYSDIITSLRAGGIWRGDVLATNLSGRQFSAWINAFGFESDAYEGSEYVLLINDISDLRQKEERLDYLAYKDALTGLSNRSHFSDVFRTEVFSAEAETEIALLFIDLDDFKLINENNSHATGDEILKYAAGIFKSSLRDSDLLARYGGDEFVIALRGQNADAISRRVLTRILDKLKKPVYINDMELNITVSIGIAFYPQDGIDGNALIRHAEMAMYDAKRERKNSVQYYDPNLRESVRDAFVIKNSLRNAVRDGELYLVYQPIVETLNGKISGMEALARWKSPRLGEVSPQRFIPIAEDADLIGEIGEWVVGEACRHQARLASLGYPDLFIAVNVSAKQLEDPAFVGIVEKAIRESGMAPDRLEIEVTESIQAGNRKECIERLKHLKTMGTSISIDDFGTGYSSLSQLSQLPLDKLKIDRSFIMDMESSGVLIDTILAMASSLRLRVVAEGVETQGQYDRMKETNCDFIQGYYFYKPLSANGFVEALTANGRKND